jgi:hypothetical protein
MPWGVGEAMIVRRCRAIRSAVAVVPSWTKRTSTSLE